MDLSTIGGIAGGFLFMLLALFLAGSYEGNIALAQLVDPPAAVMVLGGGICVVLTSVPLRVFARLPGILRKLVFNKPVNLRAIVEELVALAEIARRDGLLALESRVGESEHGSIIQGLHMAVDGTRPEVIEEVLRAEMAASEARHHIGKRMLELMGRCGPAFGMIATLFGLILMLGNLDDPNTIGPTMAMALVGTLYGVAMANMVCTPCAEKLALLSYEESLAKEIILQGILAIQAGDSPRIVEQKLSAYLAPRQRRRYGAKAV